MTKKKKGRKRKLFFFLSFFSRENVSDVYDEGDEDEEDVLPRALSEPDSADRRTLFSFEAAYAKP
jgi:hypothetical protein